MNPPTWPCAPRSLPFLALLVAAPAYAGPLDSGAYLSLAPAGVSADMTNAMQGMAAGYHWGLDGGVFVDTPLPPAIAVGAFFEHTSNFAFGLTFYRFRLGPEARIGQAVLDDRLFVYGELGLGLSIMRAELGPFGGTTTTGMVFSAGGGASYALVGPVSLDAALELDVESTFQRGGTFVPLQVTFGATWHFGKPDEPAPLAVPAGT